MVLENGLQKKYPQLGLLQHASFLAMCPTECSVPRTCARKFWKLDQLTNIDFFELKSRACLNDLNFEDGYQ